MEKKCSTCKYLDGICPGILRYYKTGKNCSSNNYELWEPQQPEKSCATCEKSRHNGMCCTASNFKAIKCFRFNFRYYKPKGEKTMKDTITLKELIDLEPGRKCDEYNMLLKEAVDRFSYAFGAKVSIKVVYRWLREIDPDKADARIKWLADRGYGEEKKLVKKTVYATVYLTNDGGYDRGSNYFDTKEDAKAYHKKWSKYDIVGWEEKIIEVEE